VEIEAPLDEPFDIGVFTAEPGTSGFTAASVLYMQRQPIKAGTQTVTVVVDKLPTHAGFDPYTSVSTATPTITSGKSSSRSRADELTSWPSSHW